MKLIILTGRWRERYDRVAGLSANYANGRAKGNPLYKLPEFQRNLKWDYRNSDNYMVTTEYDLPEGTQIELYGFCQVKKDRHYYRRIYELSSAAEVADLAIEFPLRNFFAKGRLVLVADLRSEAPIDFEKGF